MTNPDGRSNRDARDRDLESNAVACLSSFVLRARRVEAHSLAADKDALRALAHGTTTVQTTPSTGQSYVVEKLPPEEQVESAAARVRPILLRSEPIHHAKVTKHLGYLLRSAQDERVRPALEGLKASWNRIRPDGKEQLLAYSMQVSKLDGSVTMDATSDIAMAYAWIYGDVIHADDARIAAVESAGLRRRYSAAVLIVSHTMLLTIATLNFIRTVVDDGLIELPRAVLDQRVVVEAVESRVPVAIFTAEIDDDRPFPRVDELGPEWQPFLPGS